MPMVDCLLPPPCRGAGEEQAAAAASGLDESRCVLDDPLIAAILSSLAAFGRGVVQLAAHADLGGIGEKQQLSSAYTTRLTARAVGLFEDFCLASSLAKIPLSRLQFPLLCELRPLTALPQQLAGGAHGGPPLHFSPSDPLAFSEALQKLQEQFLSLVSPVPNEDQTEKAVAPTRIRKCPFHNEPTQEKRRQLHAERGVARQEAQRQSLRILSRVFQLCCRVRCSSILYSCFLMLACCSSGRREDLFLRSLASMWLLCDEADAALKTIDPSDPQQWRASSASAKGPAGDVASAADCPPSPHREASEISSFAETKQNAAVPTESSAHKGAHNKAGGHAFRRLLSGTSLARGGPWLSSAGPKQGPETHGAPPAPEAAGHCFLLAASRCQCVAYVRGFIASLLPALLWSYLTRSLLPLHAQPLPHLLASVLEEAQRGDPHDEPEKSVGAVPTSFFPRLRERFLQQEAEMVGLHAADNTSGLEDLLLLIAGSAQGLLTHRRDKRSFGAAVAASLMLPQALHLDGPPGAPSTGGNSLLQLLATFAVGDRSCSSLLAVQQQRSLQLQGVLSHAASTEEVQRTPRQLEEGGGQLMALSEGEAEAPQHSRVTQLLQREPPPQASFLTAEGLQHLSFRLLACFSCYANACCLLEKSVASAASSAEGAFGLDAGSLLKTNQGAHTPLAAGWAQCALWTQQQLLLHADDHAALIAAGLAKAISAPREFSPLCLGALVPQTLLLLAQQEEETHAEAEDEDEAVDALAARLVDGALLPLDCSCGGAGTPEEAEGGGHCLNAAGSSRVSVQLLLHLEVDPAKTGRARLPVEEPLMLQLCKTLGALLHAARADGGTRIPSWSIPLGGIECTASAEKQTDQWAQELRRAATHAAEAEQQVQRLLQQAKAAAANNETSLTILKQQKGQQSSPSYGSEPFLLDALQQQLHLLLVLHQTQHFGCNCCCCSFTDILGCSKLGSLVDLSASSYRRAWEVGSSEERPRPEGSRAVAHLWPLLQKMLLVRRLQSAAWSCLLKAERDWLPRSYWAFLALDAAI